MSSSEANKQTNIKRKKCLCLSISQYSSLFTILFYKWRLNRCRSCCCFCSHLKIFTNMWSHLVIRKKSNMHLVNLELITKLFTYQIKKKSNETIIKFYIIECCGYDMKSDCSGNSRLWWNFFLFCIYIFFLYSLIVLAGIFMWVC